MIFFINKPIGIQHTERVIEGKGRNKVGRFKIHDLHAKSIMRTVYALHYWLAVPVTVYHVLLVKLSEH